MPIKIENLKDVVALVRFINQSPQVGSEYAHIEVTFWETDKLRGFGDQHPLDNLMVRCQMDNKRQDETITYAWRVVYGDLYMVNARRAKMMFDTLSFIERGLVKLNDKFGYPVTFGQYVVRVLNVLGVSQGAVSSHRHDPVDAHVWYRKPSDIIFPIDERARAKMADWYGAQGWVTER